MKKPLSNGDGVVKFISVATVKPEHKRKKREERMKKEIVVRIPCEFENLDEETWEKVQATISENLSEEGGSPEEATFHQDWTGYGEPFYYLKITRLETDEECETRLQKEASVVERNKKRARSKLEKAQATLNKAQAAVDALEGTA